MLDLRILFYFSRDIFPYLFLYRREKAAGKTTLLSLSFSFILSQCLRETERVNAGKSKLKTKKRLRKFFRNLDLMNRTGGWVTPSFPFLSPPARGAPRKGLKEEDAEQEITISPPRIIPLRTAQLREEPEKKTKTLLSDPGQSGQWNH